ncbi:MAG: hypothetical protein JRF27_07390, partial [Deltaproteobacteria bacterium]|nr:hypothetical protein [Deltaproteobacteria bacterium]
PNQISVVNNSVAMAEELASNFYKMSESQWLHRRYDVKTLVDLSPDEIVYGPFAQVIRYEGQRKESSLGSSAFDFYKICLQDHSILAAMGQSSNLELSPFSLYIVTHELVHIVRFSKFIQSFDASPEEMLLEETRVHEITREILHTLRISGLTNVLKFYNKWHTSFDDLRNS